jgi:hypothetical protein
MTARSSALLDYVKPILPTLASGVMGLGNTSLSLSYSIKTGRPYPRISVVTTSALSPLFESIITDPWERYIGAFRVGYRVSFYSLFSRFFRSTLL